MLCIVRSHNITEQQLRIIEEDDLDLYQWEWCDGFGFLVIITCVIFTGLIYFQVNCQITEVTL